MEFENSALSLNDVWDNVIRYMRERYVNQEGTITGIALETWVCSLTIADLSADDVVTFAAAGDFKTKMALRYVKYIKEAFEAVMGFPVSIKIFCYEGETYSIHNMLHEDAPMPNIPEIRYNEQRANNGEYTFANFVVGSSNRFAHAAALAVAQNPAGPYNPLFIYGPPGLGKTHLLNAIRNEVMSSRPDYTVIFIKGVEFTDGFVSALANNSAHDYYRTFSRADMLLVDDVQFIGGKIETQEQFFNVFNQLHEAKKQIVLASDRPPKEIKALEDRLRSRFEMGLLADISMPDLETRIAIIKRKASSLNLNLSDSVCEFIASKLKSSIRQLEGSVNKLKIYSDLDRNTPITLSLAQLAVNDAISEENPTENINAKIIDEVCRIYNVREEDLTSKKRTMEISLARRVAMYVMRNVLETSLPSIGEQFNRDHSTVVYSIKQVEDDMNTNPYFKSTVEDIITNVRG